MVIIVHSRCPRCKDNGKYQEDYMDRRGHYHNGYVVCDHLVETMVQFDAPDPTLTEKEK